MCNALEDPFLLGAQALLPSAEGLAMIGTLRTPIPTAVGSMIDLVGVVLAGAGLGMLEMWRKILAVIMMVLLHAMLGHGVARGIVTVVALPIECHVRSGVQ